MAKQGGKPGKMVEKVAQAPSKGKAKPSGPGSSA